MLNMATLLTFSLAVFEDSSFFNILTSTSMYFQFVLIVAIIVGTVVLNFDLHFPDD